MRFDVFVKLKYQRCAIKLSVGVKHSMRDLICNDNYCACLTCEDVIDTGLKV